MNKLTKTEITELDTEIKQLTIMTADFLVHHNTNVDKHNYILETIKKNFERQSEIDNKVAATNSLIYQSIEIKRSMFMETLAKSKMQADNEKKKVFEEKKKKQVEQELIMQQGKFKKIEEIFKDDEVNGKAWHERQEFKVLLNNLDTMKNLNKYQIELDSYCKE